LKYLLSIQFAFILIKHRQAAGRQLKLIQTETRYLNPKCNTWRQSIDLCTSLLIYQWICIQKKLYNF